MKNILLVNPWIYDFAAYDLWMKPWGLLKLSAIFKKSGFNVFFLDAMDRHHPGMPLITKDSPGGTGKFVSEEIEKPVALKKIPRKYKRYGIAADVFRGSLPACQMDFILVSSGMTYWYPGAFDAISALKNVYPKAKIVLGGVYATLAYDHAVRESGADAVIKNTDIGALNGILGSNCDLSFRNILDETIDYSWYRDPAYGVLRISLGCPFDCSYCAQKRLGPAFILKDMEKAILELEALYGLGIRNFAFYDDALLFDNRFISEYLSRVIDKGSGASFFTPNGLHARFLDGKVAKLLKSAGFVNPVLSLETSRDETGREWHDKVTKNELLEAVNNLREAGYRDGEYTVYLMLGVPGSGTGAVERDIEFVHSAGAKISLSEFSPVPGTRMSEKFPECVEEPLLQNNSVFPSFNVSDWSEVMRVKNKARELNRELTKDLRPKTED